MKPAPNLCLLFCFLIALTCPWGMREPRTAAWGQSVQLPGLNALDQAQGDPAAVAEGTLAESADVVAAAKDLAAALSKQRKSASEAEQASLRIAAELRQKLSADPPAPMEELAQSKRLREAVETAFRARQRLHELELLQLKQRTDRLEKTLQRRKRVAEDIVLQRIDDLLSQNLRWAPETQSQQLPPSGFETQRYKKANVPALAQVTITGESPERLDRSEKLMRALANAVPEGIGNVQIELVEGAFIVKGKQEDVERVQNVIAKLEADLTGPAHKILATAREFIQLTQEGRIPEAAALAAKPSLATTIARIAQQHDLVIQEIVANKLGDGIAFSQPLILDDPWPKQLVLHCSGSSQLGQRRVFTARPYSVDQVVSQIDDFLSKYPDANVLRVASDQETAAPFIEMKFRRAEWKDVIDWLAIQMNAELKTTPEDQLSGSFSYQSPERMTSQKAFRIIQGQLLHKSGVMLTVKRFLDDSTPPLEPVGVKGEFRKKGSVLSVEDDEIVISLGAKDGIHLDTVFYVLRESKFVAKLIMQRVEAEKTACVLSSETQYAHVRVGDQVLLVDSTRQPQMIPMKSASGR